MSGPLVRSSIIWIVAELGTSFVWINIDIQNNPILSQKKTKETKNECFARDYGL